MEIYKAYVIVKTAYFYVVPLKSYDLEIDLILCILKFERIQLNVTRPNRDPSNSKEAKTHHLLFMLESRVFAFPAWTKPMICLRIC